jgi:tetratricopeptide (TPR) repeat protein
MAKPGRNDRCPCGSGKKYKACCLTKDEAVEHERLAAAQAQRENQAAEKRQSLREVRAAMLAKLAGEFAGDDGSDDDELFADDLCDDDPTDASNAVLALIHDGKLDEAEAAARALLAQYPDVHDGWDRLGMVHEKRGENRQAADCIERWSRSSTRTWTTPSPHSKTRSWPESQNSTRLPPADLTTYDHGP